MKAIREYLYRRAWAITTDREKRLRRMTAHELASVMLDAEARGDRQEQIVAEHMLHVRLARISSNATWAAGLMGFLGAIAGVFLSK